MTQHPPGGPPPGPPADAYPPHPAPGTGRPPVWAPPPPPPSQEWYAEQARQQQLRKDHPHVEPQTYPLILRTRDYAWWKPLVGLLFGAMVFFMAQILLFVLIIIGAVVDGGSTSLGDRIEQAARLDTVTPWSMLYLNLGLASLILVSWLVVRVVHGLPLRWLASVRPGIRWKFLFACTGVAVVALVISLIVGAFLPGDADGVSGTAAFPTGQLLATAVVILLTTPLQAIGEEYGFRGYLMQAFGSFSGSRVVAVVLSSGLFALAHGTQNVPLFFDRFAFGLTAGILVILVGGLEAGIALHVLNNLLAFGFAIAFDQLDSTLTVSEASWWQLVLTVTQNGIFIGLVLLVARRMGLRTTTMPAPASSRSEQPV